MSLIKDKVNTGCILINSSKEYDLYRLDTNYFSLNDLEVSIATDIYLALSNLLSSRGDLDYTNIIQSLYSILEVILTEGTLTYIKVVDYRVVGLTVLVQGTSLHRDSPLITYVNSDTTNDYSRCWRAILKDVKALGYKCIASTSYRGAKSYTTKFIDL